MRWRLLDLMIPAVLACTAEEATDGPADGGTDGATDTAPAGGETDTGTPGPSAFCVEEGLPITPFVTDGTGTALGQIAGDFTVETTTGTWVFSEAFTGCTSYVFFVHFPGRTDSLMETSFEPLFTDAPKNVEYVFLQEDDGGKERKAFMEAMASRLDEELKAAFSGKNRRDAWRDRFHFVTTRATKIEGSVGAFVQGMIDLSNDTAQRVDLGDRGSAPVPRPTVFGIDRAQTFDAGGSLSPFVGSPGDELGMAAWLPHFYNGRFDLEARLAAETDVTVVTALDELTTGRVFTQAVQLPDAGTMATFDTLTFDIVVDCQEVNPFACSEWDRIASISVCVDGEACTERRELARWITPYWRRGRQHYALDASPMLPLLAAGGAQHLHIELGPSWERATPWDVLVALRLKDTGAARPIGIVPAFGGGDFGATYNDREPVPFTPPAGTTRTELVALISGHGQTQGNNCAEWCDHRHTFSVGGVDLDPIAHEGPSIGDGTGCAARAYDGVIPGQWGNWAQSRAFWCPGMAVAPHRVDLTGRVTPGAEASLGYRASYGTRDPSGGNIALSSYVVFYADR